MTDLETPYLRMGGADGVRRLTTRFYDLMDELPEAAACRAIHPADLSASREKLFEYLSGWLGGPPLFTDKYGAPMLRRRHFGPSIGKPEADGWLACFHQAWADTVSDNALTQDLMPKINALALHMINKPAA